MAKLNDEEKKTLALFLYAGSYRMGKRTNEARKLAHKLGIIAEYEFCERDYQKFEADLGKFFTPSGASEAIMILNKGEKNKGKN